MNKRFLFTSFAAATAAATAVPNADAAGVLIGSSTLIDQLAYSDSFTTTPNGGIAGRPGAGAYPVNLPGINVETAYLGLPSQVWTNGKWSIAEDGTVNPGAPGYPGGSGAGSATGMTQSGGGTDYGLEWGLTNNYTVQFDAVQANDRIDITTSAGRDTIAQAGSGLSVFFRTDGNAAPEVGIYNGAFELDTGLDTAGIINSIDEWHNYAVNFDLDNRQLDIYVDQTHLGTVDLDATYPRLGGGTGSFAGNVFSNAAVSVGGTGHGDRTWTDNFQVGVPAGVILPTPHPDPGDIPSPPSGLVTFIDFNEAAGPTPEHTLNFAYDRAGTSNGSFQGNATRVPGLTGKGAASFDNSAGTQVNLGNSGFVVTTGITIEAMITPNWSGAMGDYDEIFRKEDGGNRILFSFQNDSFGGGANPAVGAGPVLSFGLNTGGYSELDMPLDGVDGRPLLADFNGSPHHVLATYDAASGEKAIWIDGEKLWNVFLAPGTNITSGGGANAYIGAVNGGENFNGIIDEFAFYSRALTPAEIADHYANAFNPGLNYFGQVVPEPSRVLLICFGIAAAALRRRRS